MVLLTFCYSWDHGTRFCEVTWKEMVLKCHSLPVGCGTGMRWESFQHRWSYSQSVDCDIIGLVVRCQCIVTHSLLVKGYDWNEIAGKKIVHCHSQTNSHRTRSVTKSESVTHILLFMEQSIIRTTWQKKCSMTYSLLVMGDAVIWLLDIDKCNITYILLDG